VQEEPPFIEFEAVIPVRIGKHEDNISYPFLGAQWKLLLIVHEEHTSAFAAVANLKDLPRTWSALVRFTFTLLHPTDPHQNVPTRTESFEFAWYDLGKHMSSDMTTCSRHQDGYIDRGFVRCFSMTDVNRCALPRQVSSSRQLARNCLLLSHRALRSFGFDAGLR
jgi:hypothetical protein